MFTSYFYRNMFHPDAVSIARKSPIGFSGRTYIKLAPSYDLLQLYKTHNDFELYAKVYNAEVLSTLDPLIVFNELGEEAILLCYEAPNKPCHRQLVAKWLSNALDIEVKEV